MLTLPSFAKINLSLRVLGRRDDGFHEVRTILQTIALADEIYFEPASRGRIELDDPLELPEGENLVERAARLLQTEARTQKGARLVLQKNIPSAAGLGGGSGNAAITLLGLNQLWDLNWPLHRLLALAKRLGTDVPFFMVGGTALGVGRGEEIYPLSDVTGWCFIIVSPPIKVSTQKAYQRLHLLLTKGCNEYKIQRFCDGLGAGRLEALWLSNDLEESVFRQFPEVAEAKSALLGAGCTAALMSGSGSSVFGLAPSIAEGLQVQERLSQLAWPTFLVSPLSRASYRNRLAESGLRWTVED